MKSFKSLVFVLIFILNLLKTRSTNFIEHVRNCYGGDGIRLYRKLCDASRKVTKTKLDIEFLQKCKIYNICPKFLKFKLYKKSLNSAAFYKAWQFKLLINELKSKRKTLSVVFNVLLFFCAHLIQMYIIYNLVYKN